MFCIEPTWSTGKPATDLFRIFPHHLSIMTGWIPILRCQYAAVPILLFASPRLSHLGLSFIPRRSTGYNVLTIGLARRMLHLPYRKQMFGPSLCAGGEGVTPCKRRNSNSSTLLVVHGQDAVDIHPLRIS